MIYLLNEDNGTTLSKHLVKIFYGMEIYTKKDPGNEGS